MICNYWNEYDEEDGTLYEYCKLTRKKCACCGTKEQCSFGYALEKDKENDKR